MPQATTTILILLSLLSMYLMYVCVSLSLSRMLVFLFPSNPLNMIFVVGTISVNFSIVYNSSPMTTFKPPLSIIHIHIL